MNMKNILLIFTASLLLIDYNAFATPMGDVLAAAKKENWNLAVKLAKPIADKGDSELQSFVSAILIEGKGNAKSDVPLAMHYAQLCVDNQNVDPDTKGNCYWFLSKGHIKGGGQMGKKVNAKAALHAMWMAAHLGNSNANSQLEESVCKNRGEDCPSILKQRIEQCETPCLN